MATDLREDVGKFAGRVLRRALWPHQIEAAKSGAFITVVAAARRTGKTVLAETLAVHTAFANGGCRVLILSATQDALANLTPRPPAPPAGNRRALSHGGYATVARERLEAREREVYDALAADAPLRAPGGGLPRAHGVVVRLLAECLCRLDDVAADVRDHGWKDRKTGEARPVVELQGRLRREALDLAEAMAMTTRSAARVGLDLVRTVDVATAMSEPDPERRRALLREAGLEGEG